MAAVIKPCTCVQCRYVKRKKRNKNFKRRLKRLLNKRRRKGKEGQVFNHCWA